MASKPREILPSRGNAFLEPYRRITSTGQWIPEIDGLRFVAIFLVFLYHVAGDVLRHSSAAYTESVRPTRLFLMTQVLNVGVPLFFVISGFVVSLPFARAHLKFRTPVSLSRYLWRRVTRLEPPYLLCLLLFFLMKIIGGRGSAASMLPNLMASSLYVHNSVFGRPSEINIVAWSLEIEVQFYLLAPFLAIIFAIGNDLVRRSVLAGAILLATVFSTFALNHPPLELSLLAFGQYFLAGFLLADLYLRNVTCRRSFVWDFVNAASWSLLLSLLISGGASIQWLAPWLMLLIFIAAFRGAAANRFVTNPWIATIGGMCYSIYLVHNYLIAAVGLVTEPLGRDSSFTVRILIQMLFMAPMVLATGALYFRMIERPCMNPDWPQQWSSRFRGLGLVRYFARATS